jgi:hypothetical protein
MANTVYLIIMSRTFKKSLVLTECLLVAAQNLARNFGDKQRHLLLHEAMHNLYAYYRKHPKCGYYNVEDPVENEAQFIALLKQPLGALLLLGDFVNMEENFVKLKRLQREEEAL